MVITEEIQLRTRGNCDVQDITPQVAEAVRGTGLKAGIVSLFCPGSTGGLSTIEYESGAIADLEQVLDEIVPPGRNYRHHLRWGDDNGHSHVRSTLIGPSMVVPFVDGKLTLGTWQQIIFLDFDTHSRSRRLIAQIIGE
jgi:secondary thiamine-phosphate synthase enzyme